MVKQIVQRTGRVFGSTGKSLTDLLAQVPIEHFVGMVNRSGLPTHEARELCRLFKELKAS